MISKTNTQMSTCKVVATVSALRIIIIIVIFRENNNNSNKVDLQKWNKLAVIIKLLNMEKEIQTQ